MSDVFPAIPFVDLHQLHVPIQQEIKMAIQTVIEEGDFILGKALGAFEIAFAQACGVNYGIGVASGTDAIALGLIACGIQKGDEVLVPANTFVATLMGVIKAGATPILVDCDPETALIDLNLATKALTPKTKAIVPVHLYGQMVSPVQLLDFAQSHHLIIFEDAAQAHLAQREGYTAGSLGIAAAFSFYPSKNLGAFGNGGMVVTNEETIATQVRTLRNYGAPKKYYHTEIGSNSRLDTIQAAVLGVKLPHLPYWNHLRNQAANLYESQLQSLQSKGITPVVNHCDRHHVYHLYVIRLGKSLAIHRDLIQQQLAQRGIQTGIHYPIPCHLQPAYRELGYQLGDFPHSEQLCDEILSLPMYPDLTPCQITRVVEQFSKIIMALN